MLVAVLIAALVALLSASLVLVVQGLSARGHEHRAEQRRAVRALAESQGGSVTAPMVATALGLGIVEADRLLRAMVDDLAFTMAVDDRQGNLRFWFPELTRRTRRR